MKISFMANIELVVIFLCLGNISNGALFDHLRTAEALCPQQCICTPTDMLCPNANITDVLNHGIDTQVAHLDLTNTSLDYIPPVVKFMTGCTKLNLSSNNIQIIDQYLLQNLWNLEELILSNNSINNLAAISANVLFYNNQHIKVLNLSNNPITDFGQDIDTTLVSNSLEVLDMSSCQITALVGPLVLSGLRKLTYLNLSNNPLIRFGGIVSGSLRMLNLRHCLLTHIGTANMSGLPNLEMFDVSLNEQLYTDTGLYSPNLKMLDLSMCSLRVPNLYGMVELRSAFFNGNRIRRLRAYQFFNSTKLITLDLSGNRIETVDPMAFEGLISLIYLDLSMNTLIDIPWNRLMSALTSLESFNMSHNFISHIGELRSNTIRRLDLSHCWIEVIPNNVFAGLSRLTELLMTNNPLTTLLPGSLNLTQLYMLDLSYCRISHLKVFESTKSPNLSEIKLTGNRLVTLKNGTFANCPKLKFVYLDDNPWRCECYSSDFSYMALLANKTMKLISSNRSPRCLSPDNVTGLPWDVACANAPVYARVDSRKNFSMAVGVILILCVSGLMAICVAVHENVKTRQAMRRRRNQTGEYGDGGGHRRGPGDEEYFDEYATAAESMRKLSQLPSYDEAVMLPRPSEPPHWTSKRHSCTQTDNGVDCAPVPLPPLPSTPPPPPTPPPETRAAKSAARDKFAVDDRCLSLPGLHVTHL